MHHVFPYIGICTWNIRSYSYEPDLSVQKTHQKRFQTKAVKPKGHWSQNIIELVLISFVLPPGCDDPSVTLEQRLHLCVSGYARKRYSLNDKVQA